MKKTTRFPEAAAFVLTAIMLTVAAPVFAQDAEPAGAGILNRLSFGLGFELNGYELEGIGLGSPLLGEYHIFPFLSAGLRIGAFTDTALFALEPQAFARWYWPYLGRFRLFVAGDLGMAVLVHEGDPYAAFAGGVSAGVRITTENHWYVEPYVRGGYPVIFGAGLMVGYSRYKE
jgi:hypothetical protein